MYIMAGVATYYGGLSYHHEPHLPGWMFILAGFCVQWFSINDALDGIRARRLKCGSPLGRIIDEAGDGMIYTFYGHLVGYVFKMTPGPFFLGIATINLSVFYMELTFKITNSLVMCDEYFGAMELELVITSIMFLAGIFGTDGLHKHVCIHMSEDIYWYHFIMAIFILMTCHFTFDALCNSVKSNPSATLRNGITPLITLAISVFHGSLMPESFTNEFAAFHILHSFSLNISTYKLMVANMTKKELFPIGIEHFL